MKSLPETARTLAFAVAGVTILSLQGCASTGKPAMARCSDQNFSESLEPRVLDIALSKAASWSQGAFGGDCILCAEFHSEDDRTFTLHVTSPIQGGGLVNTSATLTFSKAAGRLLKAAKYHSCQLRRSRP
jgi:hypothetical protein